MRIRDTAEEVFHMAVGGLTVWLKGWFMIVERGFFLVGGWLGSMKRGKLPVEM